MGGEKKVISYIVGFARWYMRRRLLVRLLIPFTLFILIPATYAYITSTPPQTKPEVTPTQQITIKEASRVPCSKIIHGQTILVAGPFSYSGDCIVSERDTYFYSTGFRIGLIRTLNTTQGDTVYVFSLPVKMEYRDIAISYFTIVLYGNTNDSIIVTPVKQLLNRYNLDNEFCNYFIPSDNNPWSGRYIPTGLYFKICGKG